MKRRVVITGLGVIAPNGTGKDEFWHANINGMSGIDYIKTLDVSKLPCKIAGQIQNFDPLKYIPFDVIKMADRFAHLGLASARMALDDSGIDLNREDREKVGVCIGSGLGGILFHEEQIKAGYEKGAHRLNPLCVPKVSTNSVASQIAIVFNITGPNMTISTACASGAYAVGHSFRMIQNEEADVMLAGGTEAPLTVFTFGAFCTMRVLSLRNDSPQQASRPFDKERDGFVLSEGSAVLILEELSRALKRGAHIYAEIIGYASNCGAYHMVMPEPLGKDAARVMIAAMRDARVKPEEIDYINAHGTSTQAGDKAETMAIKQAFSEFAYRIPISSTKSLVGHPVGAAGAIEAVICALSIESGIIPPTVNYDNPDPECDLDYVPNEASTAKLDTVLSNSFGFGNNNACFILRRM